jgi:hypothetical protein
MRQVDSQGFSNSLWALAKLSEHAEGDPFARPNGFENFMFVTPWAHSEQLHALQATAPRMTILTGSSKHSLRSLTWCLGA